MIPRILLFLLLAFPAWGAATVLDSTKRGADLTISNGGLTVKDSGYVTFCNALDFNNKTTWAYDFYGNVWAGTDNSGSPNGNTAGMSLSGFGTSNMSPVIGNQGGTGGTYTIDGAATECLLVYNAYNVLFGTTTLSGFTTWNAAGSCTLKWDSGRIASGWSLSGSDQILTMSATTAAAYATCAIALGSSNKVVWEVRYNSTGGAHGSYVGHGTGTSSGVTTQSCYQSNNGRCYWNHGAWYQNNAAISPTGSTTNSNPGGSNDQGWARFVLSNNTFTDADKKCAEFKSVSSGATTVASSASKKQFGVWRSGNIPNGVYLGQRATEVGSDGTVYTSGTSTGITNTLASDGSWNMVCYDGPNTRLWYYNSSTGHWNGNASANPATNTCPCITVTSGQTWYWALSISTLDGGSQWDANFGPAANLTVPSGFTMMDAVPPRSRGYIFGANDNLPAFSGDRCEAS